jgi:hypothetical protein
VNKAESYDDIFRLLTATFSIEVFVIPPCHHCYLQGGACQIIEGKPKCIHSIEGMICMDTAKIGRDKYMQVYLYLYTTTQYNPEDLKTFY